LKFTPFKLSKINKSYKDIFFSFLIASAFIIAYHLDKSPDSNMDEAYDNESAKGTSLKFGFPLDSVYFQENIIKKNEVFSLILLIENKAKDIFNFRNIKAGSKYHIIKSNECDEMPIAFIYEPDKYTYFVCDLRNDIKVNLVEREVELCEESAFGSIESSLWQSLSKAGVDNSIIDKMEEALSTSVDFYHTQKGDEFKLIFEKKYIDGEYIGLGKLKAASYTTGNNTSYSMLYTSKDYEGYLDFDGRPARKTFLKAPVKFSRISSNFNLRRFHPIKNVTIPHLGTDYAAPYGTEIRAVSDGVVTAAAYGSGNGNFVKIRHDKVYETQYLHMSRFAKGVRSGTRVRQGQTIGYVGATGLATGPHVCFRFWKNGKQINHLKEKMPAPEPLPASQLKSYFELRDKMMLRLQNVGHNYHNHDASIASDLP
jgi:murein DD-endopeptidase MepM/ murein hydrolase activator NlpD